MVSSGPHVPHTLVPILVSLTNFEAELLKVKGFTPGSLGGGHMSTPPNTHTSPGFLSGSTLKAHALAYKITQTRQHPLDSRQQRPVTIHARVSLTCQLYDFNTPH